MPIYDYKCTSCNSETERKLPMSESSTPQSCNKCGDVMRKVMKSGGSFQLKGKGWTGKIHK